MSKTPKDLKESTWKDFKAITLTGTGLSGSLRNWEAAEKKIDAPFTRKYETFDEAEKALDAVGVQVKVALDKCKAVIHAGTKDALKVYPTLIKSAEVELKKKRSLYDGYLNDWVKLRKVTKKGMTKLRDELQQLSDGEVENAVKLANTITDKKAAKDVIVELKDLTKLVAAFEQKLINVLEPCRVPLAAAVSPHMDDVPSDAKPLFNDCVDINGDALGLKSLALGKLDTAQKRLESLK